MTKHAAQTRIGLDAAIPWIGDEDAVRRMLKERVVVLLASPRRYLGRLALCVVRQCAG